MNMQTKTLAPAVLRSEDLSFVRRCSKAEAKLRWSPLHFWNVTGTGDYRDDGQIGQRLALEYLAHVEASEGPNLLAWIVGDMPRPLTDVEISFLELVGWQAKAGRGRARQIAAHWDRCEAEAA